MAKKIWLWWLGITALLLGGYETWAIATGQQGQTLSEAVWSASAEYPYLPALVGLVVGVLLGHFFWYRNKN